MSSFDITKLLESQERAYTSAMEVIVKCLTDRIAALETTVNELTTSLQFSQSEIDELKNALKDHGKEKLANTKTIDAVTHQNESLKQQIKGMEERINYQEDYGRRNNILINGVTESNSGETWEQTALKVSSLLGDKLQLQDIQLESAHRVGKRRDDVPRPIVARFTRYCDREAAMRNARKLRGTNIYFNDDLCAASQQIKNEQIPQMKRARAAGKIAYFNHTKLIVKDKLDTNRPPAVQPSVNEDPSTLNRDQQQDVVENTVRVHNHEPPVAATVASGGAAGNMLGGTNAVCASAMESFPPLIPAAQVSPHSRSAVLIPDPQETKKNSKRNVKKK